MKNIILSLSMILIAVFTLSAQGVTGKWKTIDDETGEAKSIVEIFEKDGKVYGKVLDILNPEKRNNLCVACPGEYKNKPILGMVLLKGLEKDDDEYNGGTIMDPHNGKVYKCYIQLEEKDKLKVRGYIGVSLFGRTQYWHRVK